MVLISVSRINQDNARLAYHFIYTQLPLISSYFKFPKGLFTPPHVSRFINDINKTYIGYLLFDDNLVIGSFCIMKMYAVGANRGCWMIVDCGLIKKYRKSGIASAMIKHLLAMHTNPGDEVHLLVDDTNIKAIHLYEKHGFKPTGTRTPVNTPHKKKRTLVSMLRLAPNTQTHLI